MKKLLENWNKYLLKEDVVSFDFDDTLLSTDGTGTLGHDMIDRMHKYVSQGHKVVIVTSRKESSANRKYIDKFVKENDLPVDAIFLVGGDKYNTLIELETSVHFDDDDREIELINRHAPHIKAVKVKPLAEIWD